MFRYIQNRLMSAIRLLRIIYYVENWQDVVSLYNGKLGQVSIKFRGNIVLDEIGKHNIPLLLKVGKAKGRTPISECEDSILFRKMGLKIPKSDLEVLNRVCGFILSGGAIKSIDGGLEADIGGCRFRMDEKLTGLVILEEIFLAKLYKSLNPDGKTILDVGAFIGDSAIYFSKLGAAHVIAYEPCKPVYELAKINLKLNNVKNVELYNCGVGKATRKANLNILCEFQPANCLEMGDFYKPVEKSIKKSEIISIRSIAEVLQKVGKVDAMKMDCEGTEYEILEGIIEGNLQNTMGNELIIEVHKIDEKRDVGYAKELIKKCGFDQIVQVTTFVGGVVLYAHKP